MNPFSLNSVSPSLNSSFSTLPFSLQVKIFSHISKHDPISAHLSQFECRQVCKSWNSLLRINEIEKFRLKNHYKRAYLRQIFSVEDNFKILLQPQHLFRSFVYFGPDYQEKVEILPKILFAGQAHAMVFFELPKSVTSMAYMASGSGFKITASMRFVKSEKILISSPQFPVHQKVFINLIQLLLKLLDIQNYQKYLKLYNLADEDLTFFARQDFTGFNKLHIFTTEENYVKLHPEIKLSEINQNLISSAQNFYDT